MSLSMEQLRAFQVFAMLLSGKGESRGPLPILGISAYGLVYITSRLPEVHRDALRLVWTQAVLRVMLRAETHQPTSIHMDRLAEPLVERAMELLLDRFELHGSERQEGLRCLRIMCYLDSEGL